MAMSRAFLLAFAASASATAIVSSGEVLIAGRQAPAASVFTAAQATAGKAGYAKNCASCHMPDLSGNGEISALAGPTFMETWGPRSTKQFFDYISAAMPYGQPSLTTEAYTADCRLHPAVQRRRRRRKRAERIDGRNHRGPCRSALTPAAA